MALNLEAVGRKTGPFTRSYDWKDLALYALGVGAGFGELDYCYEKRLSVIPTFGAAMTFCTQSGRGGGRKPPDDSVSLMHLAWAGAAPRAPRFEREC